MSDDDVSKLISFRQKSFSRQDEQFRNFDFTVAREMINGFKAYGWTLERLAETDTRVTRPLFRLIDRKVLATEVIAPIESKKHNIEDNIEAGAPKRHCIDDPGNRNSLDSLEYGGIVGEKLTEQHYSRSTRPVFDSCPSGEPLPPLFPEIPDLFFS